MLAWDTETALIEEAKLAPELACITYSYGHSPHKPHTDIVHNADLAAHRIARWLLEQHTATANGPYDLAVLWAKFPDLRDLIWEALEEGRVHDVVTRQKLMDIGAGNYRRIYKKFPGDEKARQLHYTLNDLHARYFGTFMEKDTWRLRYGELINVPLEQWHEGAIRYATYDAVATSLVHMEQDKAAQAQLSGHVRHNLWDESFQVRADFALHLMSCWGIAADLWQVEKIVSEIDTEQPKLVHRLKSVDLVRDKGGKKNVRNEKLAKAMMYKAVGNAGELTDTGYKKMKAGELTHQQALQAGYIKIDEEWCENSGYPALIDYFHYRQNQLLRAKLTHIQRAAIYRFPVQTSYEPLMETGRTSSRENKLISNSMALQNPPRKGGMRECFVARPGCTLIAADYGQAELVSLAQVTYATFGHSKMRDLLNADMDIHVDFGRQILSTKERRVISYAEAWTLYKAENALMEDMRQAAKAADFGFPGGLGWASFQSYARKAWGVELTGEESKQLKINWLRHFPEMRDYFKWMGALMDGNRNSRADIQQYMSKRWRGRCYFTQGCNTLFQGLTADAAKAALFEVSRLCYSVPSSPLYGCRPVLFVHDEIIMEAPLEQAAEAALELERVMVEVYVRYTPDVKITADAHLMSRWSKSAKAVHDERGKLIPWNPPQDEDERWEFELMEAA